MIANLLHPKEVGPGNESEQLAAIADAYQRWQLAHFFTFLAILAFAISVVALAVLLWPRDRRSAFWGGVLGVGGLLALMGVLALDGFSWAVTGEVWSKSGAAGRRTAELVLHDLQSSEWGLMFYVTGVAWILGMLVLAAAAGRTRLAPAWAAGLLALGSILVGLEGTIHANAFFVIASVVLLAGGTAVAATLSRDAAA